MAKTAPKRRVKITDTERLDWMERRLREEAGPMPGPLCQLTYFVDKRTAGMQFDSFRAAIDEAMRASQKKESK